MQSQDSPLQSVKTGTARARKSLVPGQGFNSNHLKREKMCSREYNRLAMATVTLPTEIQPRSPQGEFRNEPFTDFKNPENARKMQAALDLVAGHLGHEYDLIIGGIA